MQKILALLFILVFSSTVFSKDMTHRLGVGFKSNTSTGIPSIAAVYFSQKELAFTGSIGIDTQKNNSAFQASAGLRYVVFFENNLNAYVSGQAGFANMDALDGNQAGAELLGLGGVEFFFSGLENLSFCAEAGIGIATMASTRFYTTALDPFRAGITFYF